MNLLTTRSSLTAQLFHFVMSENNYERYTFSHDLSRIFGKSRVKMCNVRNCFLTIVFSFSSLPPNAHCNIYMYVCRDKLPTFTTISVPYKDFSAQEKLDQLVACHCSLHSLFSLLVQKCIMQIFHLHPTSSVHI